MKYTERDNAIILLSDGTVFYGKSAGIKGTTTGEICFNTGATGYQEVFTDPSYFGQIMLSAGAHMVIMACIPMKSIPMLFKSQDWYVKILALRIRDQQLQDLCMIFLHQKT